jgi:hypothetical protein
MKKVNKNSQASRLNSQALLCIFPGQTATSHRHYTHNAQIIPIGAPFPPLHNEYNINPGPYKLQTVKKVTKNNKLYSYFSSKK